MRRFRSVTVSVDVDMSDLDTEDLVDELAERGKSAIGAGASEVPPLNSEDRHPLHEIYYALKFGLDDKALELTRAYVNDQLGTAL